MDREEWDRQVEARKRRGPRRRPAKGRQAALLPEPEVDVRTRLRELLPVARALVAGALANRRVQELCEEYPGLWSVEKQKRFPTVRVEFAHAIVIGHVGEGVAAGEGKSWGPLVGVFPLDPDDPVDSHRILYCFKRDSPYQRRFDQRKAMKEKLGPGFSKLVNRAMGSTLAGFRPTLTAADVVTIGERLGMGPSEFWRAAKGRVMLPVRAQRPLFAVLE